MESGTCSRAKRRRRKKKDFQVRQTDLNLNPLSSRIANDLTIVNISFLLCRGEVTVVIIQWGVLGIKWESHMRNLIPSLVLLLTQSRVLFFLSLSIELRHRTMKIKTQKAEKIKNSFPTKGAHESRDQEDALSEMTSHCHWVRSQCGCRWRPIITQISSQAHLLMLLLDWFFFLWPINRF